MIRFAPFALLALLLVATPAQAQLSVDVTDDSGTNSLKIAVPALPTSQSVSTPAGTTDELGVKIAQVIADDLRNSGLFAPTGPEGSRTITMSEVMAPQYPSWTGFEALVHGFVRSAGGRATSPSAAISMIRR